MGRSTVAPLTCARPNNFAKPSERGAFSSAVTMSFPCAWPAGILMPAADTPVGRSVMPNSISPSKPSRRTTATSKDSGPPSRTGVPELFRKREEFDAYIEALTNAGIIDDSSYVWWALRPSLKHPTLELRAPDACTFVDDSIAIAALYRSLARMLCRNPLHNFNITAVTRALIVENKWRAQRYGIQGIPFIGLFENGELVRNAVGAMPRAGIEQALGLS